MLRLVALRLLMIRVLMIGEMDVHARLSKQSKRSRSFYRDEESEFSYCPLKVQRFDR